jgi:hypothetical protein
LSGKKYIYLIALVLLIAAVFLFSSCSPKPSSTVSGLPTPAKTTPGSSNSFPSTTSKLPTKTPEAMPLKVNGVLDNNGMYLNVQAMLFNPNSVPLEIDNVSISAVSSGGTVFSEDIFPGGFVDNISSQTFKYQLKLPQTALSYNELNINFKSRTANTATPIELNSSASFDMSKFLKKAIAKPQISIAAHVHKILNTNSKNVVDFRIEGSISNTNPVSLNYHSLVIAVSDKKGVLKDVTFPAGTIADNSSYDFEYTMILPVEVLNESQLTVTASTSVQYLNYVYSIYGSKILSLPDLADLITIPEMTLEITTEWNTETLYIITVKARIPNDNKLPLTTADFHIQLYDNETEELKNSATMSANIIQGIPAGTTRSVIFKFDYLKTDIKRGFEALVMGDIVIGLEGVNKTFPLKAQLIYDIDTRK